MTDLWYRPIPKQAAIEVTKEVCVWLIEESAIANLAAIAAALDTRLEEQIGVVKDQHQRAIQGFIAQNEAQIATVTKTAEAALSIVEERIQAGGLKTHVVVCARRETPSKRHVSRSKDCCGRLGGDADNFGDCGGAHPSRD